MEQREQGWQEEGQEAKTGGHFWFYVLSFFFFFNVLTFLKFNFNWRIIALWCDVGFYFIATWISYVYTYTLSLWNLPPTTSHPTL